MDLLNQHYQALDSFVEKVKKDENVIGVLLAGSLYKEFINENSDINIILIIADKQHDRSSFICMENDLIFNIDIFERTQIIQNLSRQYGDMYRYSFLSNSKFIFCKDQQLENYLEEIKRVKKDSFEFATFSEFSHLLHYVNVIYKYLNIRQDLLYIQYNFVMISELLAKMEHSIRQQLLDKDAVVSARGVNEELMKTFNEEALIKAWDVTHCEQALNKLEEYFENNLSIIQKPIVNIFHKSGKMILTLNEIAAYYRVYEPFLYLGCDYLAKKQVLKTVSMPVSLLLKSKVKVEEIAYFYNKIANN